jgi:hypothetical protein
MKRRKIARSMEFWTIALGSIDRDGIVRETPDKRRENAEFAAGMRVILSSVGKGQQHVDKWYVSGFIIAESTKISPSHWN